MSAVIFPSTNIAALNKAMNPDITTGQLSPVAMAPVDQNAKSPNADENPSQYSPTNTPILVSGNGSTSQTAIKKSNMSLSHACDSSSYVGKSVAEVGAKAGQLMRSIRDAVKAALAALGINAAASALTNQLKKIARYIQSVTKFIKEITQYVTKLVEYLNAIKQLISYLQSLPARLLQYFADCIKLLQKQLAAGFTTALGDVTGGTTDIQGTVRDVTSGLSGLNQKITVYAATASTGLAGANQIPTNDPTAQSESTTALYEQAGYRNTSEDYGKP